MDSHSSKYIYDTLKGDIENNLYSFGSALPSERTLAEKYFVSRTTVRNAIEQLVHDGLLYKIQGKGTYVSMPKLHATNSVTSTRKYLKDHHLKPSTKIITSGIRNAGYKYSNIFNISESDQLFFVYRQRLGNKIPYSVEYTFLPFAYVPNAQIRLIAGMNLALVITAMSIVEMKNNAAEVEEELLGIADSVINFCSRTGIDSLEDDEF